MGFSLGRRAVGQLKDQAGQTRRLVRNSDAYDLGAADQAAAVRNPNTQWLRVTSTTSSGGYYPALLLTGWNGSSFQDLDGVSQVWLAFPRGYTPTGTDVAAGTPFLARQDADNNGAAAFAASNCPC